MNPTVENVLSEYLSATVAEYDAGMNWYPKALEFAKSLDRNRYMRAAGIVAALSPMNQWDNNMAKAAQFYAQNGIVDWQGNKNGIGLPDNVRKCERIWSGEDALDVLTSDKVRSFFLSIIEPFNPFSTPVIDRHAFDIAIGKRTNDAARSVLSRKGEYERFAEVYRQSASIAGIGTSQLQAITWVAWKRRHGLR